MRKKKPNKLHVLCIDPGVRSTGFAYWRNLSLRHLKPDETGVWRAPSKVKWQKAVHNIAGQFLHFLYEDLCIESSSNLSVVCEWPQLWTGSAKSMSSGSDGDLFKLAHLVGALDSVALDATTDMMTLVTPNQWKAQLPKEEIIARIHRKIGVTYANHAADAVGIGFYLMGLLPCN